jgi:hypothetical protein
MSCATLLYPVHDRLPTTLAELQGGWEIWLQFALEARAISRAEQADLQQRGESALAELAALQVQYHQASDPALRFVTLLRAALAAGHAHVADRHGRALEPGALGLATQTTRSSVGPARSTDRLARSERPIPRADG